MYAYFTYYISSPMVSYLQSAPPRSRKRNNIAFAEKKRKAFPPPPRGQNRARRRDLALSRIISQSDRYRGACRRGGTKHGHCTLARFIDLAIYTREERHSRSRRWTATIPKKDEVRGRVRRRRRRRWTGTYGK